MIMFYGMITFDDHHPREDHQLIRREQLISFESSICETVLRNP
jgi:hypothetical protein